MGESIEDVVNEITELLSSKINFVKFPENSLKDYRKKMIMENIKSNLDYIRLAVKYKLFDLEAINREKQYLIEEKEQLIEENEQLIHILEQGDIDYE